MNESETTLDREDGLTDERREIANMDEYDYLSLLMESRIIQAS